MLLFSPYIGGTSTPGGPSGPTFVNASSIPKAYNAASPATHSHTMASASNVLIALIALESAGTSLDTSIDSGGGAPNFPTVGGTNMVFGALGRASRRHAAIYGIHPNTTGSVTFSIQPANGIRSIYIRLEEWANVNTTTIFNNTSGSGQFSASMPETITTTDATGYLLGACCATDEATAITVTTPAETINLEGQTGGAGQDIRGGFHRVAVSSAGATEGITFDQTGNSSGATALVELNPA